MPPTHLNHLSNTFFQLCHVTYWQSWWAMREHLEVLDWCSVFCPTSCIILTPLDSWFVSPSWTPFNNEDQNKILTLWKW